MAFVRVCSGRFEKDMTVKHARTGKAIRLSRPRAVRSDRAAVEDAYPGDVTLLSTGMLIGDTFMWDRKEYEGIPCFSPEIFSCLNLNPLPSRISAKG